MALHLGEYINSVTRVAPSFAILFDWLNFKVVFIVVQTVSVSPSLCIDDFVIGFKILSQHKNPF